MTLIHRYLALALLAVAFLTPILGRAADDEDAIDADAQPPIPVRMEQPVYPFSMRLAGLTGTVTLEFVVDRNGNVRNPHVHSSNNPWFERPALDAVMKWKFKPGHRNGRPVNTRAQVPVHFELSDGSGVLPWKLQKSDHSKLPPEAQWEIAPEPVHSAFPVYPYAALVAGTKGKTRVNFVIGPNGDVVQANVLEAPGPEFRWAVQAMLDTWKFKPARKGDGSPCYAVLSFVHEFVPSGRGDVPVSESAQRILRLIKRGGKGIVSERELDAAPKPLSQRPPAYPLALRQGGQAGSANVEFFIDELGDAQLPRVISATAPEFGYSAVQAVATWRFTPPLKGKKAVPTRAQVTVEFTLEN